MSSNRRAPIQPPEKKTKSAFAGREPGSGSRLAGLSAVRLVALTALGGALATLAMAPFQWPLASYLSLWPLFYLGQRLRNSLTGLLAAGLLSSFFCSIFAFHWFVLTIQNFGRPGLFGAVAIYVPLALVFQFKFVVFVVAYGLSRRLHATPGWLFAGMIGAGADLLTPNLFPWYWGNLLAGNTYFAQLAEFVGPAGLSFVLFALSHEAFAAAAAFQRGVFRWRRYGPAAVAALLLFATGATRLYQWRGYQSELPHLRAAILQTNAPLETTTADGRREPEVEAAALELMRATIPDLAARAHAIAADLHAIPIDLIALPESAVPYYTTDAHYLNRRYRIFQQDYLKLAHDLTRSATNPALMLNETNFRVHEQAVGGRIRARAHNSAALFLEGERADEYHKGRLLPFGEYAPGATIWKDLGLGDYLPAFLQNSRFYPGNFETNGVFRIPLKRNTRRAARDPAGTQAGTQAGAHAQALPTICYEIIFPGYIREFLRRAKVAKSAPGLLVNLTQDGWYGDTIETHQHFELARLRSIETRRALIRANNTGASGFVDLTGEIVAPLNAKDIPRAFDDRGVLIQDVPIQSEYTTLYMRAGSWWMLIPIFACGARAFILRWRRSRQPSSQG